MLADEPTGNLDSAATLDVLRLFEQPARGRADAGHRHPRRADRGHRRPADLDARRRVRRRDPADRRHHRAARRARRAGGLSPMGRVLLVCRLAVRDLRRRRAEAALLLLAIMAATTTLTLGLVLRDAASEPVPEHPGGDGRARRGRQRRLAPRAPATPADLAGLEALADAPGVIGHSGPYPVDRGQARGTRPTRRMCRSEGRDAATGAGRPARADPGQLGRRRRRGGRGRLRRRARRRASVIRSPWAAGRSGSSASRSPPPCRPTGVLLSRRLCAALPRLSAPGCRRRPGLAHPGGRPEPRPAGRTPSPTS